ncbi:hypothetical protein PUN28_019511 [Cardiocondyla obscurior]|uniref:ATP synthase F0 subunit 8 n=1 Tax=Cardiocondyla obscurior TaxID=286306 RepID=A0AAW2ECX2_9HYME
MPNCMTNFTWYLGKFIIGFAGLLYLYTNFWKEKEKKCVCDVRLKELLRAKNEEMQRKRYLCGCSKSMRLTRKDKAPVSNDFIKHNKSDAKSCYARRNSC